MAPKRKYKQLETPEKNKIAGAVEFCQAKGIPFTKTAISEVFSVSRHQIDTALQSETLRSAKRSEIRASNAKKLPERDLDRVERFLVENGPGGHELTWDELASQFGFEVQGATLRERMATRRAFMFLAAEKPLSTRTWPICVFNGVFIC